MGAVKTDKQRVINFQRVFIPVVTDAVGSQLDTNNTNESSFSAESNRYRYSCSQNTLENKNNNAIENRNEIYF